MNKELFYIVSIIKKIHRVISCLPSNNRHSSPMTSTESIMEQESEQSGTESTLKTKDLTKPLTGIKKKKKKTTFRQLEGFYIHVGGVKKDDEHIVNAFRDQMIEGLAEENEHRKELGVDELTFSVFLGEQIRIFPTKEEELEKQRKYREIYRQLPHVVEKRIEKSKLPEVIEKRLAYSKLERVITQKKLLAARRRAGLKKVARLNPALYREVMSSSS